MSDYGFYLPAKKALKHPTAKIKGVMMLCRQGQERANHTTLNEV